MADVASAFKSLLRPVIVALAGLILGVGVTAFAGENPFHVLAAIAGDAFGTRYDLGMTLFYATPLIFTGLAVALPFHAGLFNIGGEGQLAMGALFAMLVGVKFADWPAPFGDLAAICAAFAGGALWGLVPGWLKARRGSHEVITTIMMNFIAAGLASWVVLYLARSPDTQNPESARIGDGYALAHAAFFDGAPVSVASVLALVAAVVVAVFLTSSKKGFEIRAVGANAEAAASAGIAAPRMQILVMALAGGLAGLVGVAEVLGNSQRFKIGFSPDFGFIGIPVALLARCNPLGVVLSALLFGALQKGTAGLDLQTDHVTRDLASIIQAVVVLAVSVEGIFTQTALLRILRLPAFLSNRSKTAGRDTP